MESRERTPLSKLFSFALSDPVSVILILIGTIAAVVNGLISPLMSLELSAISAFATGYQQGTLNSASTDELWQTLLDHLFRLGKLACYALLAGFFQPACFQIAAERQGRGYRRYFFQALLRRDLASTETETPPAEAATRLRSDTDTIQEALAKTGPMLQHLVSSIACFYFAFTTPGSFWMAIVMALAFPLPTELSRKAWDRMYSTLGSVAGEYAKASSLALTAITHVRTVQSLPHGISHFSSRYAEMTGNAAQRSLAAVYLAASSLARVQLAYYGARTAVFLAAGYLVKTGTMTLADGINTFLQLSAGSHFVTDLIGEWSALGGARDVAARVWEVIDGMKKEERDGRVEEGGKQVELGLGRKGPRSAAAAVGKEKVVEFKNVKFSWVAAAVALKRGLGRTAELTERKIPHRYPSKPETTIFTDPNGLSFTIPSNCTSIAIVGATGSGKSSLANLLLQLYKTDTGTIYLDGAPLEDHEPVAVRSSLVSLVPQDPTLFDGTIAFNVTLDPNPPSQATKQLIWTALEKVGLDEFVRSLPLGIDQPCGPENFGAAADSDERKKGPGIAMSGGERQRLNIARTLFLSFLSRPGNEQPRLLILDEHSSALDPKSTAIVAKLLETLRSERTVQIAISHKLAAIKSCDLILVMEKGRLVQRGKFDELVEKQGVFRSLWSLQVDGEQDRTDDTVAPASDKCDTNRNYPSTETKAKQMIESWTTTNDGGPTSEPTIIATNRPFPWRTLLSRIKPAWRPYAALGLFGSLLEGLMVPLESYLLGSMVAVLSRTSSNDTSFINNALLFLLLAAIAFVARFGVFYGYTAFGTLYGDDLRQESFEKLLCQDSYFYRDKSPASASLKLSQDPDVLKNAVVNLLSKSLSVPLTVFGGFAVAFSFGWKLTVTLFLCAPLLFLAGWAEMAGLAGFGGAMREAYAAANARATEYLLKSRTIKVLAKEEMFERLYELSLASAYTIGIERALVAAAGTCLFQSLLIAVLMIVFAVSFRLVVGGEMEFGTIVLVILSVILASRQIGDLINSLKVVGSAKASALDITDILDGTCRIKLEPRSTLLDLPSLENLPSLEPKPNIRQRKGKSASPNQSDGVSSPFLKGTIELRDVSFSYTLEKPALTHVNFAIPCGSICAVVGRSGSGKSTLISLLQRIWDPDSGSVLIDGMDLRNLDLATYRRQIAVAPQDPTLFEGSIGYNITIGSRDGGMPLAEACKLACLDRFVDSLPRGLETPVGDLGASKLSGGEKQRLSVSRALIARPRIFILDEPTSALDAETAERLVENIVDYARREKATVIIVSHLERTIRVADMIVAMEDGRVAEVGTHGELMKRTGLYSSLFGKGGN